MDIRAIVVERPWAAIKRQRIFRDRFLGWFIAAAALTCLMVWVLLLFWLQPTDMAIPYTYTGTEFGRGPWYLVYGYGLYSLLVTGGNIALAAYSFDKSRIGSFFLLLAAIVLNVFTIVITSTLLSIE